MNKPKKEIAHGVHIEGKFKKPSAHKCGTEHAPKAKKAKRNVHHEEKKKTKHQQYAEERDYKKLPRIPESRVMVEENNSYFHIKEYKKKINELNNHYFSKV